MKISDCNPGDHISHSKDKRTYIIVGWDNKGFAIGISTCEKPPSDFHPTWHHFAKYELNDPCELTPLPEWYNESEMSKVWKYWATRQDFLHNYVNMKDIPESVIPNKYRKEHQLYHSPSRNNTNPWQCVKCGGIYREEPTSDRMTCNGCGESIHPIVTRKHGYPRQEPAVADFDGTCWKCGQMMRFDRIFKTNELDTTRDDYGPRDGYLYKCYQCCVGFISDHALGPVHGADQSIRPVAPKTCGKCPQKEDPYKSHEDKMKKDLMYQQYLLNQNKCELCGKKGDGEYNDSDSILTPLQLENKKCFLHKGCFHVISKSTVILGCSFEESFNKLRQLFVDDTKNSKQPSTTKGRMLGSSDFIGNPWNK